MTAEYEAVPSHYESEHEPERWAAEDLEYFSHSPMDAFMVVPRDEWTIKVEPI